MSQHRYDMKYEGRDVCVLAGWDRPLQGCFMTIDYADSGSGEVLYSNLDEVDSHPPTFEPFAAVLERLSITLPARMLAAIRADIAANCGNRYQDWTGSPLEQVIEIAYMLVVSTAHITFQDSQMFDDDETDLPVSSDEYGYILRSITPNDLECIRTHYSDSMTRVAALALLHNCTGIRFDRDGPLYDPQILPVHDW